MCTQRRDHLRTQREGSIRKPRREALGASKPPTLRSWVSSLQDCEKQIFTVQASQAMVSDYGSPRR